MGIFHYPPISRILAHHFRAKHYFLISKIGLPTAIFFLSSQHNKLAMTDMGVPFSGFPLTKGEPFLSFLWFSWT